MSQNNRPKNSADWTKEQWAEWRAEVAAEEAAKADVTAYDDTRSAYADPPEWINKETKSYRDVSPDELADDWENLRRHAILSFPEGKTHVNLTGPQKLVAIALCMQWSIPKIAAAAKISESSIKRLVQRADFKKFLQEYRLNIGEGDPNEMLNSLAYQAIKFAGSLINDPDASDSMKRLKFDAAKWLVERRYGKSAQPIDVKGLDVAAVFKHIQASAYTPLSDDEETDLFTKN